MANEPGFWDEVEELGIDLEEQAAPDRSGNGGATNGRVWSNYLVTMNPNMQNTTGNRMKAARAMVSALQGALQNTWQWLHVRVGNRTRALYPAERHLIKWVRARPSLENQGQQNRSPHMHVFLEICHTTNISLDYNGLTGALKANLEGFSGQQVAGTNVQIKYVDSRDPANKKWLLHYLLKEGLPENAPAGDGQLAQYARGLLYAHQRGRDVRSETVYMANDTQNDAGPGIYPRRKNGRLIVGQDADQRFARNDVDLAGAEVQNV